MSKLDACLPPLSITQFQAFYVIDMKQTNIHAVHMSNDFMFWKWNIRIAVLLTSSDSKRKELPWHSTKSVHSKAILQIIGK